MGFKNIAELTRRLRVTFSSLSQVQLSKKLGYKNGQFISNIERAHCSIPIKSIKAYCLVLEVNKEVVIDSMVQDYRDRLERASE